MADWLAEVRARYDPTDTRTKAFNVYEDVRRLLACAEALRELVTLRDAGGQYASSYEWRDAWERARRARRGEGG